jgi:hypothetical protein
MDIDLSKLRPYPTPPPDVAPLQERYKGSRTEKFSLVMGAVEAARGEAENLGMRATLSYATRFSSRSYMPSRRRRPKRRGLRPFCDGKSPSSLASSQ